MLLNLNLFLPLSLCRALLTAFEIIDLVENLMKAIFTVQKNQQSYTLPQKCTHAPTDALMHIHGPLVKNLESLQE